MLLAIDIGNTNITCGMFAGSRLKRKFNIATKEYSLAKLKRGLGKRDIDNAVICSVVPKATRILENDLKRKLKIKAYVLGRDIVVPVKNLYHKRREVGQDRLVNAYAGVMLYGAPLIVIDFGTAITFDVISQNKEYLGGMILPGLRISLEALYERTALLPKIKLEKPRQLVGRDTKNSMLSGIVYGFAALADDLSQRIKAKIGKNAKVIATGGNCQFIQPYCRRIDKTDLVLTLKGIVFCLNNYLKSLKNT